MSECVVRMEMPKSCRSCPLCSFIGSSPVCARRLFPLDTVSQYYYADKKPSNCPILYQLPDGHGRLVSEKDVRWAIDDIVIKIAERIGHVPMTKNETMEYVNQLPTIVPEERSET